LIDPKIIKENQTAVKEMLANRNMDFPLDILFMQTNKDGI